MERLLNHLYYIKQPNGRNCLESLKITKNGKLNREGFNAGDVYRGIRAIYQWYYGESGPPWKSVVGVSCHSSMHPTVSNPLGQMTALLTGRKRLLPLALNNGARGQETKTSLENGNSITAKTD